MKIKFCMISLIIITSFISCVSTKSTLKNVNNSLEIPKLTMSNTFIITQFSSDSKYGFHPDYPINVFYKNTKDENANQNRFLKSLSGPKGEKLFYKKIGICCPFPTKNSELGSGFLDIYEITWVGQKSPIKLYFNIYEKGELLVPVGLKLAN